MSKRIRAFYRALTFLVSGIWVGILTHFPDPSTFAGILVGVLLFFTCYHGWD